MLVSSWSYCFSSLNLSSLVALTCWLKPAFFLQHHQRICWHSRQSSKVFRRNQCRLFQHCNRWTFFPHRVTMEEDFQLLDSFSEGTQCTDNYHTCFFALTFSSGRSWFSLVGVEGFLQQTLSFAVIELMQD